jgi:hypothetical protein
MRPAVEAVGWVMQWAAGGWIGLTEVDQADRGKRRRATAGTALTETGLADGSLSRFPWLFGPARPRGRVGHGSTRLVIRPRRTRCPTCAATPVLLPATVLPRRADTTAAIGTALLAHSRSVWI